MVLIEARAVREGYAALPPPRPGTPGPPLRRNCERAGDPSRQPWDGRPVQQADDLSPADEDEAPGDDASMTEWALWYAEHNAGTGPTRCCAAPTRPTWPRSSET
jgi:hypothetical protein